MVVSTGGGDCCCSGSEARIGECRLHSRHSGGSSHPPIPPAGPTRLIPPGFRVIRSTSTSSTFPPTPVSPFVCVVCGFEFFGPYDSSLPAARCDSAAPRACKSALSSATRCWGISCLCVGVGVCVCVCVCVCVVRAFDLSWMRCVRERRPACQDQLQLGSRGLPRPAWWGLQRPPPTCTSVASRLPSSVAAPAPAPCPHPSSSSTIPACRSVPRARRSLGLCCGPAPTSPPPLRLQGVWVFRVCGCVLCVLLLCVCGCVCSVS